MWFLKDYHPILRRSPKDSQSDSAKNGEHGTWAWQGFSMIQLRIQKLELRQVGYLTISVKARRSLIGICSHRRSQHNHSVHSYLLQCKQASNVQCFPRLSISVLSPCWPCLEQGAPFQMVHQIWPEFEDRIRSQTNHCSRLACLKSNIDITLCQVSRCPWATGFPCIHSTEALPLSVWRLKASPFKPTWRANIQVSLQLFKKNMLIFRLLSYNAPCMTTSARLSPFYLHSGHSTPQAREHLRSTSQTVCQHSTFKKVGKIIIRKYGVSANLNDWAVYRG